MSKTTPSEVHIGFGIKEDEPTEPAPNVIIPDTDDSFARKIAAAQNEGAEWLETDKATILRFNRHGLNGAKFFIYQGIKVSEHGQSESIDDEMNAPLSRRLHGAQTALVDGRDRK